ncbi:GIY-YIG nuclease family protein [Gottfriedia acidiceleris]|uniref:GIY-YIG nuclease family protein n=1 Tax=Gottfriedia acidiceleris TaxID=371036 RepID=UPI003D1B55FB
MKYKSGVYKIINKITGKYYIGQSIEIEKRFWRHKYELSQNIHHCLYLQRSWNKYGEESFIFQIYKECEKEEAVAIEQNFLDNEKVNLYNTSDQVSGGDLISSHPNRENIIKKYQQQIRNVMLK